MARSIDINQTTHKFMKNFWASLKPPILALAPMYDVTDAAFRRMVAKYGKPDILWTEFVSANGLVNNKGREKLLHHLLYSEQERPIVAQIFGANPENFNKTAKILAEKKFNGIDINMGCPDKAVIKQGSCAALFHNPELAGEIIRATKLGAPNLPVSVKIRIGDTKIDWEKWIERLLQTNVAAITIHLRTRKEMSKAPAHWEEMPKIMKFVQNQTTSKNRPIILGNGDVLNIRDAKKRVEQTGCDGVMIGRGAFGNPWIFNPAIQTQSITPKQKLQALYEHLSLFNELLINTTNYNVMKKHFKAYLSGFPQAGDIRDKLYSTQNPAEGQKILLQLLQDI